MSVFGRSNFRFIPLAGAVLILLIASAACVPDFYSIFVTLKEPGTTADGVQYGKEDILMAVNEADPTWEKIFDGSNFGLTPRHDIAAFSFNEFLLADMSSGGFDFVPELYLSFAQNRIAVPDVGIVQGQDVVKFKEIGPADALEEGTFEMFFDGSDVGLTTISEKIDGLGVWPPEYFDYWISEDIDVPYDCAAGVLFITTQGNYRVPAATPGQSIVGKGSDVLLFCAFNTGPDTSGVWYRVYNGVEEGIRPYQAGFSLDVLGFDLGPTVTEQAKDLDAQVSFLFTPRTNFTAPGLSSPGQPSQVFVAETGSGVFGPEFDFNNDAMLPAVNGVVDGLSVFDFPVAP